MKKVIFFVFIFWVNLCFSQNFQNVCLPGISFYKDSSGNLSAFRRDSLSLLANNDSVFFSYYTIRDTMGVCKDTSNGSVLGRKVLKKSNGWIYFFNRFQDSIRINTQASLNQTWKFYDLPSGSYIQAQVTSIFSDTVLGIIDMDKLINLQAKNSSNNNIPHILNGKIIRLSQHYGLAKMLDVYNIPNDTILYTLSGLSSLNLGDQDLTWEEVYNFDIGDIFHFDTYWWTSLGSWYHIYTIENILGKTIFGNNDSVLYQVEMCYKKIASYPPHYTNFFDTVTISYNFQQLGTNDPLLLPGEFVSFWDPFNGSDPPKYYAMENSINGHQGEGKITGWTEYDPTLHCYSAPFESFYTDNRYTSGLGHTQDYYQYWSDGLFTYNEVLVYYKKGTETWGTPVATDCTVLTDIKEINNPNQIKFEVTPNPAKTQVSINITGVENLYYVYYSLYNCTGVKEIVGSSCVGSFIIERKSLPSGLYLLYLTDSKGCPLGRTKILFQ